MEKTKSYSLGMQGEEEASRFLQEKNYTILERNWRYRRLEVDIIARFGEVLVFCEVKTRSNENYGKPEHFVDPKKQKNLERAAGEYIHRHKHKGQIRFDIISITKIGQGELKIFHIEDAFFPY